MTTRMSPGKAGAFLVQQTDELTRIWRVARAMARPSVFPGLTDDLVAGFFPLAGEMLSRGAAPEEVWQQLGGVVRWSPAIAPQEIHHEWEIVGEILTAVCESVNADPSVAEWLFRAIDTCAAGSTTLVPAGSNGPPGILTAFVFSTLAPRQQRTTQGNEPPQD